MEKYEKHFNMTMDLLKDSFKWKMKARECESMEEENKYMQIANMLYDLYEKEYQDLMEKYNNA